MTKASIPTSLRCGAFARYFRPFLMLLLLLSGSSSMAGTFGMHYWPQEYSCNALTETHWPRLKPIVEKDLDHLASLGVGAIRLMFWPGAECGYSLNPTAGTGGTVSVSEAYKNNLRDLIALMGSRGFDIYIGLDNTYLKECPRTPGVEGCTGPYYWDSAYSGNFEAFAEDSRNWVSALADAAELSPFAHKVRFYDFIDEASGSLRGGIVWQYIAYLYDHSTVPAGKRGVSLLHIPVDAAALKAQVIDTRVPQRHFDFVTFNTIGGANVNNGLSNPCPEDIGTSLQARFDELLAALGKSASSLTRPQILLGSFGLPTPYDATTNNQVHKSTQGHEDAQKECVIWTIQAAKNQPQFFAYVHWMFTDFTPHRIANHQTYGLIYANPTPPAAGTPVTPDMHSPKAVLGAIAQEMALGNVNFDMGNASCTTPANWWSTPDVTHTFSCGHTYWDTATGDAYGRITVLAPTEGTVWMATRGGSVAGKTRLYVNFFFRSTLSSVRPEIHEYNSAGQLLLITRGPAYTPTGWSWNNYLHRAESWSLNLQPGTDHVIFAVAADIHTSHSVPAYLDVDTVSLSAR
ncbi:hypothetical protein F0U60_33075 [Archangium minus]|uniref:Uncharacterized protein n=1 Tax=Archangium minus TaxID=83450 RepID=A0ABY9WZ72_9BACT|nr:hypothetical protein F0U60_33075 [Archangium minus]